MTDLPELQVTIRGRLPEVGAQKKTRPKRWMDVDLAEATVDELIPIVIDWVEAARQYARNAEYYRGLVIEVGEMFGPAAYVSDDGSVQQDVLCAKVPELVREAFTSQKENES